MSTEQVVTKDALIRQVEAYLTPEEVALIDKAFVTADRMHDGQKRKSGEPYIMHPYEVALILASLEADGATVAAGLLHDVLEDCHITSDELRSQFGPEVTALVEGVTKLGKISFSSKEERQAENFRRMFMAMGRDIRVILLKLCDRLHNMRTLTHMAPEKQREIARETLEIFAPLAHRLGLGKIKWELEDWSLRYSNPEDYYALAKLVAQKRDEREAIIHEIVEVLEGELGRLGVQAKLSGRPKHFYSIYQKMRTQNKDFSDLYDITAVRVLVDSVKECYEALGVVHAMWKPIPGRFKDYIAMPKSNLYQSLHTAVIGPSGRPVEVQIRTHEMHRVAEYGIAAHWRYKEGGGKSGMGEAERKFTWLRQLLDWQNDLKDAEEYLNTVKEDLFADEVFVFSPHGDVIDLPRGATPVDFAYRIHTDVGHRCTGAKINGRIVPLTTHLQNGDIVEIITSKNQSPSRDWISFVATTSAKNRIRQWYKKERRDENIARAKESLEREIGRNGLEQLLKSDKAIETATKLNYHSVDDMLAAIGYGELSLQAVLNRLKPEPPPPPLPPETPKPAQRQRSKERNGILVDGSDSMMVTLAKCCSPVPGEPVGGVVTRTKGVSVHSAHCPNLAQADPGRVVAVEWARAGISATYPVEIEIELIDRVGLLKDISAKIADLKTNIRAAKIRSLRDKSAMINLIVDVSDLEHLQRVLNTLNRISDVIRANRVARLRPTQGRSNTRATK